MPITILDLVLLGVMLISGLLAMVRGFMREILSIAAWGAAALVTLYAFAKLLPTAKAYFGSDTIAAVVVGGTLLTGGMGSVGATLVGVLLLGLIFNILNFENGRGSISLSAYWQSVIRGVFLLIVIILQNRLAGRRQ